MSPKALVRIPNSISQGGTCKTNLRGVATSAIFDFVSPSRTFTTGPNLVSETVVGGGLWKNTIKRCFANGASGGDAKITYPSIVSTSTSATILIRLNVTFSDTPILQQGIFQNGTIGADGYGIVLKYEITDYNLYFVNFRDMQEVLINSTGLNTDTWYQISIRFFTDSGVTTLEIYQDGSRKVSSLTLNSEILSPSGSTILLDFYGKVTDFALIEKQFTDTQLKLYGTAPYV